MLIQRYCADPRSLAPSPSLTRNRRMPGCLRRCATVAGTCLAYVGRALRSTEPADDGCTYHDRAQDDGQFSPRVQPTGWIRLRFDKRIVTGTRQDWLHGSPTR